MCYTKTGLPCGLLELAVRCSHGAVGRVLKLTLTAARVKECGLYHEDTRTAHPSMAVTKMTA